MHHSTTENRSFRRCWTLFLAVAAIGAATCNSPTPTAPPPPPASPPAPSRPPHVVLILADDLGYGDLSSYGNREVRMPNLDRLAAEGARLTSFYTPVPVCQPSRAALLTGRYPVRVGVPWNGSVRLDHTELTIADLLRARGYRTAMVGKWHLGWSSEDMPIHYGFDSYYGIPAGENITQWIRGDHYTGDIVQLPEVTVRYTEEATSIIRNHPAGQPLFLYLAHRVPHDPYVPSARFDGISPAGVYGDLLEELDWSVGEVVRALRESNMDRDTVILFMSDNGPVIPPDGLGSTGPLIGQKATVAEGGVRVPAIAWSPSRIRPNRVIDEITTNMDVLPTLLTWAGGELPEGRHYDGTDISRLLSGELERLPGRGIDGRREVLFWIATTPTAIRSGKWKYYRYPRLLFDLDAEMSELTDLRSQYPSVAEQLAQRF